MEERSGQTVGSRLIEWLRPYYLRLVYFQLVKDARPRAFVQCWQYPFEELGGEPRITLDEPEAGKPDLVFFPMTDWHVRTQRTQHMAAALAEQGFRCFLVNPNLGRQYKELPAGGRHHRLARLQKRVYEIHAVLKSEPVFHHRMLNGPESSEVAEAVGTALARAGSTQVVAVVSLPTWWASAEKLRSQLPVRLVYDCHDWLAGFGNMAREIAEAETAAIAASDAVFFSSQRLRDALEPRISGQGARCALLRNGAPDWPEHRGLRPAEPVVGYVGALEDWFDADLLASTARSMPEVSFRLAGSVSTGLRNRFKRLKNVEFLGEISHDRLPSLLRGFRAAIIPFRRCELIQYTDPIKIYEYFHFGLPVVTTWEPDHPDQRPLAYCAQDPMEFERALRMALDENDPQREQARRKQAADSRWSERISVFRRVIESL
ncbi:MAG: glycosyltransferase [Acidobacteria bacterium]|nr:glycosyltransferase [Acidobacteriota bacterium]